MSKKVSLNETGLTAAQSQYVLNRLIAERRVTRQEVGRAIAQMQSEIRDLEQRLRLLRQSGDGQLTRARRGRGGLSDSGNLVGTRHSGPSPQSISPETRASRVLQGKYLSLIRRIPRNRRGKFQKIALQSGREAAINAMQTAKR